MANYDRVVDNDLTAFFAALRAELQSITNATQQLSNDQQLQNQLNQTMENDMLFLRDQIQNVQQQVPPPPLPLFLPLLPLLTIPPLLSFVLTLISHIPPPFLAPRLNSNFSNYAYVNFWPPLLTPITMTTLKLFLRAAFFKARLALGMPALSTRPPPLFPLSSPSTPSSTNFRITSGAASPLRLWSVL